MSWMKEAMLLFLATALVGCGDSAPSRTLGPASQSLSMSRTENMASRPSVTGHATAQMPEYDNAPLFYDIVAIRRPNGDLDGRLNLRIDRSDGRVAIQGDPVCLTVNGDTARLAARVIKTNSADLPLGSFVIWNVVDNHPDGGEKQAGGRQPDMNTVFAKVLTQADAEWHCMVGIVIGPFHPVQGNLTVHERSD